LLIPSKSGNGEFLPYKTIQPAENSTVGDGCCALAVMAKAPRPGRVKTRLSPPLSPDQASELNVCFIRDTTENIQQVTDGGDSAGIVVYTPIGDEAAFDGLLPTGFQLLGQRGDSFGERLLHAAEDLFACGFNGVCLIDSDSPTMPQSALSQAVALLARDGDRVVLGGSDDGGYYLIGVKHMHPRLFAQIDWSTERVLEQTLERAREIGLETALLPTWYDVDDAATLKRLQCELLPAVGGAAPIGAGYDAKHTRAYLESLRSAQIADARRPAFTASRAR
jgi:rSAM/selenodomain-associated transferase 1